MCCLRVTLAASRLPTRLTAVASVATLLGGCLSKLPEPNGGPFPHDAMVEVPYPPPPARVQAIPVRPKGGDHDVWVDGQWDWDGHAWKWLEGSWVDPPRDAYFTPWTTERRVDGRLFFARAAWRGRDGRPVSFAQGQASCPAVPPDATATQVTEIGSR